MMRFLKKFIVGTLLMMSAVAVAAQSADICPSIVETALSAADTACDGTGRNEVCYGNIQIEATAREGAADFTFTSLGDMVSVQDVEALALSGYDEENQAWGVAIMRLQANIPDTLPGQNVTFVLFGDVRIADASEDVEGDFGPMQAFYLQSGIGDSPCKDAPDSGILVQTPEGVATINLKVNGVDVSLGSTAFLTASAPHDDAAHTQQTGALTVSLLEGSSTITAAGESQTLTGGEKLTVPMTEDLLPAGPPTEPQPIEELGALPVDLLPETISLDPAASTNASTEGIVIEPGTWVMTVTSLEGCGMDSSVLAFFPQSQIEATTINDIFTMAQSSGSMGSPTTIDGFEMNVSSPEPGTFEMEFSAEGTHVRYTIRYISPTLLEFTTVVDDATEGCTITMGGSIEHSG